jgi:hypothetical protein
MAENQINEITWTRVRSFRKEYIIEGIGTHVLKLKRKGVLSGSATGELNGEKIDFLSKGDFNRTIIVENITTGKEIGSMDIKWYGNNNGLFLFFSGKEYVWKCVDFFRGQWAWFNKENEVIMTFLPENLFNKSGRIKMNGVCELEDISLLAIFGLHLKLFFNYWIIFAVMIIIWILKE